MLRQSSKNSAKLTIDIGLTALCEHAATGQTLSSRQIADVCECSYQVIDNLTKSATKKLKRRMKLAEHLEN